MNVTPIVNNSVTPQNFKGNNERKTGGAGKGWASAAIPGLGQFIDGRIIAGVGFLGGSIGLLLAQKHYSKDAISIMKKEVELLAKTNDTDRYVKKCMEVSNSPKMKAAIVLFLARTALWIVGIVNASKGVTNKD